MSKSPTLILPVFCPCFWRTIKGFKNNDRTTGNRSIRSKSREIGWIGYLSSCQGSNAKVVLETRGVYGASGPGQQQQPSMSLGPLFTNQIVQLAKSYQKLGWKICRFTFLRLDVLDELEIISKAQLKAERTIYDPSFISIVDYKIPEPGNECRGLTKSTGARLPKLYSVSSNEAYMVPGATAAVPDDLMRVVGANIIQGYTIPSTHGIPEAKTLEHGWHTVTLAALKGLFGHSWTSQPLHTW